MLRSIPYTYHLTPNRSRQNENVDWNKSNMTDGGNNVYENELKDNSWDGFHNWLYCVCVVTFDLELGQALEVNNP